MVVMVLPGAAVVTSLADDVGIDGGSRFMGFGLIRARMGLSLKVLTSSRK